MSDTFTRALNTLTHLDYHWLWGIRYHKTPKPVNIGTRANDLLQNNEILTNLIDMQQNLYQKPVLIRFFYWLFNIDNYAYNAYLLVACHVLMEHNNPMNTAKFLSGTYRTYLTYPWRDSLKWLQETLRASVQPQENDAVTDTQLMPPDSIDSELHEDSEDSLTHEENDVLRTNTQTDSVTITLDMLPDLFDLGLHLNRGDLLSHDAFKSACRKKYLESHPDKPGGTKESFLRVKHAIERLTEIIFSRANSKDINTLEDNLDDYWSDFYARADEVKAEQQQIAAEQEQLGAEFKQIGAEFKQIGAEFKQIGAEQKQIAEEQKQIAEEQEQIGLALVQLELEKEEIKNMNDANRRLYEQHQKLLASLMQQQGITASPIQVSGPYGFFAPESEQEEFAQPGPSPKAN